MSNVLIRIYWYNFFGIYYWSIDDLKLSEGYTNDLRIENVGLAWDDQKTLTNESFSSMIPLGQLGHGHKLTDFKVNFVNMGGQAQNDVIFEMTISKSNSKIFEGSSELSFLDIGWRSELLIENSFEPNETGDYLLEYKLNQKEEDDNIEDNTCSVFFKVTDSVYSRADEFPNSKFSYNSLRFIRDGWDLHANVGHFFGSVFPIYSDCEVKGISTFITGGLADGNINFRYTIWKDIGDEAHIEPYLLLASDWRDLDSSMFNQRLYLPVSRDGESEFIQKDEILWVGVQYSNWHEDEDVRRTKGMSLGVTNQTQMNDRRSIAVHPNFAPSGPAFVTSSLRHNLMVHLILEPGSAGISNAFLQNPILLAQNYPNPVSDRTTIEFKLDQPQQIEFMIQDAFGRVLLTETHQGYAGGNSISFNVNGYPSGIYFYTIKTRDQQFSKSMVIAKN